MAKTKKKKEVKKGFEHSVELYGIFFILIAILGIRSEERRVGKECT